MSMDQPTLPGMGHLATQFSPVNPAGAPSARARLSRAASTRVSYEQRSEDGNISLERMADGSWKTGDYDEADIEDIGYHPRTGLPAAGEMRSDEATDGRIGHIWGPHSGVPAEATYWGSTRSARNKGDLVEIPIQSSNEDYPAINTVQERVSAQRVNSLMGDRSLGSTPRIPRQLGRDVPVVWQEFPDQAQHGLAELHPPTLIDGNHRMTADVLSGQLFAQVRQITPQNLDKVAAQSAKVKYAEQDAQENEHRNPYAKWDMQARAVGTENAWDYYGSRKPDYEMD